MARAQKLQKLFPARLQWPGSGRRRIKFEIGAWSSIGSGSGLLRRSSCSELSGSTDPARVPPAGCVMMSFRDGGPKGIDEVKRHGHCRSRERGCPARSWSQSQHRGNLEDLLSVVRRESCDRVFSLVEGLKLRPPDRVCDRALDDKELAAVILTARHMLAPFGAIL